MARGEAEFLEFRIPDAAYTQRLIFTRVENKGSY